MFPVSVKIQVQDWQKQRVQVVVTEDGKGCELVNQDGQVIATCENPMALSNWALWKGAEEVKKNGKTCFFESNFYIRAR